jgi:uncharacterized membrane protein YvbJ
MKRNDKIHCFKTAEDIEKERKSLWRKELINVVIFAIGIFVFFLYTYYLLGKILSHEKIQ